MCSFSIQMINKPQQISKIITRRMFSEKIRGAKTDHWKIPIRHIIHSPNMYEVPDLFRYCFMVLKIQQCTKYDNKPGSYAITVGHTTNK